MDGFQSVVQGLFPGGVVVVTTCEKVDLSALYPEEQAVMANAVFKRRSEFAMGRWCAREALSQLGFHNCSILPDEDRSPMWPEGIVGSISHAVGKCAGVAAALSESIKSVGLDIEVCGRLKEKLWKTALLPQEIEWVKTQESPDDWATVMFSAKEAFYKCQHPLTKQWVGFQEAHVSIDKEKECFNIRIFKDLSPIFAQDTEILGKFCLSHGYVIAAIVVEKGR